MEHRTQGVVYLQHLFFSALPLFCQRLITVQHLFDMKWGGQMYSMLISPVHAQSKSSLHSADLKSSSHTPTEVTSPFYFLLPLRASCECDNVLCSEIHTISVRLAPNVSKKKRKKKNRPVSFSGWMTGTVESALQERTLVKRTPMEGSCLTACHQLFKA